MPRAISRLAIVLAGALVVAGLVAAPAFADPLPPSEPATTTLSFSAPSVVRAHESTRVVATLEDASGTPVPGELVAIVRVTSTTETVLFSGPTDSEGHVSAKVKPKSRIRMRARFAGSPDYLASASPVVVLTPQVALAKPWTHDSFAMPGQWLPARGALWPQHSKTSTGTKILCERKEHGRWVLRKTYGLRVVNSHGKSRYDGKFRLPTTGTWRVRIRHDDDDHAMTTSAGRRIVVSRWRARYVGHKVGRFRTKQKLVAITIDDGPNPRTLEICSILERYGAKGTFFFIGDLVRHNKSQVRKAYDRGHEIANHTQSHDMLTHSYASSYASLKSTKALILGATGFAPNWVRGMGGSVNETGLRAVDESAESYVNWSVTAADTSPRRKTSSQIYHRVVSHIQPGDVILMHQTHPESIAALPRICRRLKARGYKMVTVSELASVSKPWR